jgi:hypothetical protein
MEKGTCEGENKKQLRSVWGSRSGVAPAGERRCRASGGRTPCRGEKKSRGSGREEKREIGGDADGWDRLRVGSNKFDLFQTDSNSFKFDSI